MELIFRASEESFLHIGTMIGFFILLFEYFNHITSGKFSKTIAKHRKLQPLFGALMGAIPGCGGTIALVPLYMKGSLSYGTILSSLIASLGDAAFVLMSSDIKLFLYITILLVITGVVTGYLVDVFKIGEKLHLDINKGYNRLSRRKKIVLPKSALRKSALSKSVLRRKKETFKTAEQVAHEHGNISKLAYVLTHSIGYKLYIAVLLIGFIFMTIAHSSIELPFGDTIHEMEEIIAVCGIGLSIIYTVFFNKFFKDESVHDAKNKKISLREMLVHSTGQISFVISWIFIAYILYDILIFTLGGDAFLVNLVLASGIISVIIGAALGLIPGCGIQILLMSLYLKGNVPLGALVANAISQDGDALFPLLAMNKKAALWSMVLTTIPALILGIVVYYIF
ncbi:MAG: putative manganese transporter [Clostridioides sp.]|nr:putative manganese transporter [Clostridioides sp.]